MNQDPVTPGAMPPVQLKVIALEELTKVAPDLADETIRDDADLRDEFDLDSMDFLNWITALHRRLGVDIQELDYPKLTSLAAAADYLMLKLRPGEASGAVAEPLKIAIQQRCTTCVVPDPQLTRRRYPDVRLSCAHTAAVASPRCEGSCASSAGRTSHTSRQRSSEPTDSIGRPASDDSFTASAIDACQSARRIP